LFGQEFALAIGAIRPTWGLIGHHIQGKSADSMTRADVAETPWQPFGLNRFDQSMGAFGIDALKRLAKEVVAYPDLMSQSSCMHHMGNAFKRGCPFCLWPYLSHH
jgi:hypothetical protein